MYFPICFGLIGLGLLIWITGYIWTRNEDSWICCFGGFIFMATLFFGFGLIAIFGTGSVEYRNITNFKVIKTDKEVLLTWFDPTDGKSGEEKYNDVWLYNNSNKIQKVTRYIKKDHYGWTNYDMILVNEEGLKKQAEIEKWTTQQQH